MHHRRDRRRLAVGAAATYLVAGAAWILLTDHGALRAGAGRWGGHPPGDGQGLGVRDGQCPGCIHHHQPDAGASGTFRGHHAGGGRQHRRWGHSARSRRKDRGRQSGGGEVAACPRRPGAGGTGPRGVLASLSRQLHRWAIWSSPSGMRPSVPCAGRRSLPTRQSCLPGGNQEVVITVTAAPIRRISDDTVELVVSVMRDETEIEHLERTRDELFASAAHSFKTPLAIIKGQAQLLTLHAHDDRVKATVAAIDRQCDKVDRLIQNLLAAARLRSKTLRFYPRAVDLAPVVAKVGTADAAGDAQPRDRRADRGPLADGAARPGSVRPGAAQSARPCFRNLTTRRNCSADDAIPRPNLPGWACGRRFCPAPPGTNRSTGPPGRFHPRLRVCTLAYVWNDT